MSLWDANGVEVTTAESPFDTLSPICSFNDKAGGVLVMRTMVKPKKKHKPTDNIPFAMTKAERTALINEIDALFGDKLVQYTSDVADPEEGDHVIALAVLRIKKLLKSKTYAEAESLLYAKDEEKN